MVKSCCSAAMLAVIIISLSLEADAQSTVDETTSCSASTLDEVMTRLDEVVDMVKMIASNQQQNAEEIRDLKKLTALMSIAITNCTPLLIQQNVDGSSFFNRSWAEFRVGFGDPSGNYWLGNELLSQLTASDRYKLRFDLQSRSNGNWYYAEYSTFRVLTEADNYRLQVAGFSGNATDALNYHNGMQFSTYDSDNDLDSSRHCALRAGGGFWYKNCYYCGVNAAGSDGWEFHWFGMPGGRALQTSRMWLECK